MSRRWVFCRLRQLAAEGFAVQTVRGYWRREMTICNRERKVQAHALTRVCTYSAIIGPCTCTKPAPRSVTNRNCRTSRFATQRSEWS
jgi:hypothetical protein